MISCGISLIFLMALWIRRGKTLTREKKRMIGIFAGAALLGMAAGMNGCLAPEPLAGNRILRNEAGGGAYEKELKLGVSDWEEDEVYVFTVPEQKLTKEEEKDCLAAAGEEIAGEFPGDNVSAACIRDGVVIRDTYQGGKVEAQWSFDNYKVLDTAGNIIAEDLPEDGELVKASVELVCGESTAAEEFYFQVFPPVLDQRQEFFRDLEQILAGEGEKRGAAFLELPQTVGNHTLTWQEKRDYTPEKLLLFGGVLAGFVPLLSRSRERERRKKRDCLLELEYPDMVSKMALLLGSGMTLQGAWKRIALSYERKRSEHRIKEMPVYEEMMLTCREMENGVEESRAYLRFGERCGMAAYRRFGNILGQNLKKGSQGIVGLLEHEAEDAFEERKSAAKRYGEEAGTKLLFPMMLMLSIVMLILLVPAMAAFQL